MRCLWVIHYKSSWPALVKLAALVSAWTATSQWHNETFALLSGLYCPDHNLYFRPLGRERRFNSLIPAWTKPSYLSCLQAVIDPLGVRAAGYLNYRDSLESLAIPFCSLEITDACCLCLLISKAWPRCYDCTFLSIPLVVALLNSCMAVSFLLSLMESTAWCRVQGQEEAGKRFLSLKQHM